MPSRHESEVILAVERQGPQGFLGGSSVRGGYEGKEVRVLLAEMRHSQAV